MSKMMPKQFIENVLINEIGTIHKKHAYISFAIMAIGIEFLGKSLNEFEDWNKRGRSQEDFELAINSLDSFRKYRPFLLKYKLWDSLRNGFAHSFVPKKTLSLSSKKQTANLVEKKDKEQINLRCEEFYIDFKNACKEVLVITSFKSGKMDRPLLRIPNATK